MSTSTSTTISTSLHVPHPVAATSHPQPPLDRRQTAIHIEPPRNLNATVEDHHEHVENYMAGSPSSSIDSSAFPSRDEILDLEELDEAGAFASVARRDFAHELARSLWGVVGPKNFGHVASGIYRSSYPKPENFQFLRTLGLKTILTLVPEELPGAYRSFIEENGITHFQIGIEANKDPKITISSCKINAALGVILQKSNHPILVHCNKGKHRTGTVIGCLQKIQGKDMDSEIIRDYRRFAGPKARWLDERFIEQEFDERGMLWLAKQNGFAPPEDEPRSESPISALSVCKKLRG